MVGSFGRALFRWRSQAIYRDRRLAKAVCVAEGARAVLHLIEGGDLASGNYYRRMERSRAPEAQAYDEEARARLDSLSRELTGLSPATGG